MGNTPAGSPAISNPTGAFQNTPQTPPEYDQATLIQSLPSTGGASSPAAGTWPEGALAQDTGGGVWVCTVTGTPGTWVQLASSAGDVVSVFGRAGVVTAQTGDYTAAKVTNAADKAAAGTQTFTGIVTAPALVPSGLTGSVAAARFVGGTVAGAPVAGAHLVGDVVVDQSGALWICTVAGTPGTWVEVGAGGGVTASAKAADFNAAASFFYYVDASGAAVAATLPAPANGAQVIVKKIDASGNAVTVTHHAAETIDGAATYVLTSQYQSVTLISDGTNWWVV